MVLPMTTTKTRNTKSPLALLYVRVSTDRQANEGHSLEEQERVLRLEAERRGYTNVEVIAELGKSAKAVSNRPVLIDALDRLDSGEAAALLGLDLDRLSRSVSDFAGMLHRAGRKGWTLVVVGLGGIDTSSAEGALVSHTLSAAAQYERSMISRRVTRQHEARRQRGETWGVTTGPKPELSSETRSRIGAEREAGMTLGKIAEGLNNDAVKTARGGKWHASTIAHVLKSLDREAAVSA